MWKNKDGRLTMEKQRTLYINSISNATKKCFKLPSRVDPNVRDYLLHCISILFLLIPWNTTSTTSHKPEIILPIDNYLCASLFHSDIIFFRVERK